jgi:hypothetical protein
MLVVGPLSGLVALRWGERFDLRREALRAGWIATARTSLAAAVAEQRRALAAEVQAGLELAARADAPVIADATEP